MHGKWAKVVCVFGPVYGERRWVHSPHPRCDVTQSFRSHIVASDAHSMAIVCVCVCGTIGSRAARIAFVFNRKMSITILNGVAWLINATLRGRSGTVCCAARPSTIFDQRDCWRMMCMRRCTSSHVTHADTTCSFCLWELCNKLVAVEVIAVAQMKNGSGCSRAIVALWDERGKAPNEIYEWCNEPT